MAESKDIAISDRGLEHHHLIIQSYRFSQRPVNTHTFIGFHSDATNIMVWSKISLNISFRIHHSHLDLPEIRDATSAVVKGIKLMKEDNILGGWYTPIQSTGK